MKSPAFQQTSSIAFAWKNFLLYWLIGMFPAYFLTSYFSYFFSTLFQFLFIGLIFQCLCGLTAYVLLEKAVARSDFQWRSNWTTVLILCLAVTIDIAATRLVLRFPNLFNQRIIFMEAASFARFAALIIPSMVGSAFVAQWMQRSGYFIRMEEIRLWKFIQQNLPGILLAVSFFFLYFVLAQCINFPGYNTVDRFFDTDISEWLSRLAYITPKQFMARAVHPAILIFLRPLVELIAIFLHGDKIQAVFLLNTCTGAAGVFLMWLTAKKISDNTPFSLIIAFLLGIGTPHLLLSSMIETYAYSAFALILFVYLLVSDRTDLKYTIPVGILVFGITITNIVQTCILYLFKKPRIKVIFQYIVAVLFITLILNIVQVKVYHYVKALYDLNDLIFEQKYTINFMEHGWVLSGRFWLMVRSILLYAVVAPKPFILTTEIGTILPTFSVFKITIGEFHVAGYTGFSDLTVKVWMVILFVGCVLFVWNLIKSPKQMIIPLGLVLCMGFNLLLHTFWGDDPMLYSPDWAYALVLFVAYALQKWADKKWLQILFIVFLGCVAYVNLSLIQLMIQTTLPFYAN
ncbi:MAG: hypothetical protein QM730_04170 [Anaerolineales bacterium]